jgi:hypothetical protein
MKAVIFVLVAIVGFGCRETRSPRPEATPPSPPPIVVTGPLEQTAAFDLKQSASDYAEFVLDLETKKIFVVNINEERFPSGTQRGALEWLDDNTIAVPTTTGRYRVPLSGPVSVEPGTADIRPILKDTPRTSPDGAWEAKASSDGLLLTGAEGASLMLPSGPFAWSPTGHQIAVGGGRCGNGRLTLADPALSRVLPISTPAGVFVTLYLWRPDSAALAVDFITTLSLVRAIDGAAELLAPLPPAHPNSELTPLAWSPSGTRLLFRLQGGYDCGD